MGPATSDADAFAAFVRSSARSLFGTAYLLTGDGNHAEELVQDTLARLYPRWPRIGSLEAPLAYARRALANRFVSQQRRPMSRELVMAELPEAAERRDLADEVTDRGMLSQLLRTLPERQRAALVLRYFHDLPDDEIARSARLSAGHRSELAQSRSGDDARARRADRTRFGSEVDNCDRFRGSVARRSRRDRALCPCPARPGHAAARRSAVAATSATRTSRDGCGRPLPQPSCSRSSWRA